MGKRGPKAKEVPVIEAYIEQGKEAYIIGKLRKHNPYRYNHIKGVSWYKGWDLSKQEIAQLKAKNGNHS